jgi:molybdopterin molybdotransferase
VRVRLQRRSGQLVATPTGPQGSHIVTSLLGADALAVIPAGHGELEAGATVALEPLAR